MALTNALTFIQHDCGDYDVLIDDYGKSQFLTITRGVSDALIHIRDYYATFGDKLNPTGSAVTLSVEDWVQLVEQHERISAGLDAQLNCDYFGVADAKIGERLWYKINDRMGVTILPVDDKAALSYDKYFGVRVVIGYKKRKQLYHQHVHLTPRTWSRIMAESNRMQIASIVKQMQKEISASNPRKQPEHNMYNPPLFSNCLDLRKKIALIFCRGKICSVDPTTYTACLNLTKL